MKGITMLLFMALICFSSKDFSQTNKPENFHGAAANLKSYKAL
jgi:hypothetical protein